MKKIIIIITCFIGLSGAFAQQREIFHNPVIEADVPDPSMIRVGNYYYLVSTTMHLMQGCQVMRSKDLVHWETISYVFQRLTDLPRYDLKEGTVYGRGQWASSIRYHDGRFYVWFSPNDEPHRGYIYTAEDPAGEWTLVSRPPHHHDASLFFDDDGKVYLFYGTGQLRQLKSDLSDVEPGGIDQKIFERDADEQGLLEGSQAFKHNGRYYVMMISMDWSIPGRLRREVCYRADQITGPYEKKVSGPRCGFSEINLPPRQNGSSIMPGKVNPVIPEVVSQVAFNIIGNDVTVTMAAEAGQLELNAFEPIIFYNLIQSVETLTYAVHTFVDNCVTGITANRERCRDMVEHSVGIITALCPHVGYEKAAEVAKRAIETGAPVRRLILEEGLLDEAALDKILDPYSMTEPGISGKELLEG